MQVELCQNHLRAISDTLLFEMILLTQPTYQDDNGQVVAKPTHVGLLGHARNSGLVVRRRSSPCPHPLNSRVLNFKFFIIWGKRRRNV